MHPTIDEIEWNFSSIPPSEIGAAAVWEFTRSSKLPRQIRSYLSTPFSWIFDSLAEDQVVWGGWRPKKSGEDNPAECDALFGNAVVENTLKMLSLGKHVPDEVLERLIQMCPDELYFSPLFNILLIFSENDKPWRCIEPGDQARIIEKAQQYYLKVSVNAKLNDKEMHKLLDQKQFSILKNELRKFDCGTQRKRGRGAELPFTDLKRLSAYRLNEAGWSYLPAQTVVKKFSKSSKDPSLLPLYSSASEWCRAVAKTRDILSAVSKGDYSFLDGRAPF